VAIKIDLETQKRLEELVQKYVSNPGMQEQYYEAIGSERYKATHLENVKTRLTESLQKLQQPRATLYHAELTDRIREAQKYGLNELVQQFAELAVNAPSKEVSYGTKLFAAELIECPNKKEIIAGIKKRMFFKLLTDTWNWPGQEDYLQTVRSEGKNLEITPDEIKKLAESAYGELMGKHEVLPQGLIAEEVSPVGRNIYRVLQAAQLAKEYLTEKEQIESGSMLIERNYDSEGKFQPDYPGICLTISDLELPSTMTKKLMLDFFENKIGISDNLCGKLIEKHKFNEDEIKPIINDKYSCSIRKGDFRTAIEIHKHYPEYLHEEMLAVVQIEDIKLLEDLAKQTWNKKKDETLKKPAVRRAYAL